MDAHQHELAVVILIIVRDSAREIWHRLMDTTDPEVCNLIDRRVAAVPGVLEVHSVSIRWIGHWQHGELHITVEGEQPTKTSHNIAEECRHGLFHALPSLQEITIHIDPVEKEPGCEHLITAHHINH